jgi:hypothetical protein
MNAAAFAGLFLAFSLALDWWGRLLLKVLKASEAVEPCGMLGCICGAAGAFVACRWLSFFTRSFETPLAAFVALGLLGSVRELLKDLRRLKRQNGAPGGGSGASGATLRALLSSREWAAAATPMAFALAFWFCGLWPSGGMEPWLSMTMDYYSWIFQAGYWMGYSDAGTYGIAYQHPWIFDGFGTDILFAMFSSARGVPAYLAAPGFSVLLLSWIWAAVYALARKTAGLPRWLAWLAALGVVGGWFFKYLFFCGAFAQLASSVGYLVSLGSAFSLGELPAGRARLARAFFPLLYLFMCYQAGYLMFAAIFAAAAFLWRVFGGPGAGAADGAPAAGDPPAPRAAGGGARLRRSVGRVFPNAWAAARTTLGATVLCAAASPQTAWQVASRTFSAASQTLGWGVGFLDPGLFAGFPLIADSPFGLGPDASPAAWAVFLAAFALLCTGGIKRAAPSFAGDVAGLKALAALFVAFIVAYLASFASMGDDYRVWKFASMTALPLSFMPAAMLVRAARASRLSWAVFAAAAGAAAFPVLAYRSPEGKRANVQDVKSLLPLAETVAAALDYDRDAELVVFDFSSVERTFAAMAVSQYSGVRRVRFVAAPYFGEALPDYLAFAAAGAPVYSDRTYPALFDGGAAVTPGDFTVYRYGRDVLGRTGAVSFYGVKGFTRMPNRRGVKLRILVPEELRGLGLAVRISFDKGMDGLWPSCVGPTAREERHGRDRAVGREGGEFLIRVPPEGQRDGFIGLYLEFPDLPAVPSYEHAVQSAYAPSDCRYSFAAVELSPDGEAASRAGDPGRGEPAAKEPEGEEPEGGKPEAGDSESSPV